LSNVIVITGPTATGKTKIAVELANKINGEIISADSMQIYKNMNIGTAKPDKFEMKGVRHYLIDEVYPYEEFNVAKFKTLAIGYIEMILKKNKIPIVVGGTGLYINSLIYNIEFSDAVCDWELREKLKLKAEKKGTGYLHKILDKIDPEAAKNIHENDIKRVIRAIEVYVYTKKPISYHKIKSRDVPSKYEFTIFGLRMARDRLYEEINKRVDIMVKKGLVDEVKKLKLMGYDNDTTAMQGLGYKEMLYYLGGEATFKETVNLLKRNTRRFAKRQMTWFRGIENITWFNTDKYESEVIIKNMLQYMELSSKM